MEKKADAIKLEDLALSRSKNFHLLGYSNAMKIYQLTRSKIIRNGSGIFIKTFT